MTCACIPNKDETLILQACQLHELWYLQREHKALLKLGALLNTGERTIDEAFKAAASAEPPPDQRSTDATR